MTKIQKILTSILFICLIINFVDESKAQIVRGFNYQAVARDNNGNPLSKTSITIKLSVFKNNASGLLVWQENHSVITNEFGLFNFVIGEGVSTGSGSVSKMSDVKWANDYYFIQVQANFGNGLVDLGTVKL